MKKYSNYTSNEIKPSGWLKKQLEIQANGLSGNLDKMWPDIRDSAWIGGDRDGWERVPYWLDGFIPLAYLLDDDDMKKRAQKYIDAIIKGQKESGWICPCCEEEIPSYDTWAIFLLTKVLVVYYDCTKDERIPGIIYKTLKNFYDLCSSGTIKLKYWGKFRWFECFIAINFLKQRYNDSWIVSLAAILEEQGADYLALSEQWKIPLNDWKFETHIVNIAMMLKYEAVSCDILGKEYSGIADRLYSLLNDHNGTPVGLFTGDECVSGLSPIQGSELCSVVELMYSYEILFAYTGDNKWAELLETIAFNALPATISDDMWTHQYDQMSNQINCKKFPDKPIYRSNGKEAGLFGLEPNYGCCTANFNQGWPKFALSAFMHKDSEIISAIPVPSELHCSTADIVLDTEYPFKNTLSYSVTAHEDFDFVIRIPSFAKNITACGKHIENNGNISYRVSAGEKKNIVITFDTEIEIIKRPYDLCSVRKGSLLFSVPIKYQKVMYEYEKDGVERKFPYCDYEYVGVSDWNYALSGKCITSDEKDISDIPFSSEHPPITLTCDAVKIDWGYEEGYDSVCAKIPHSRIPLSKPEKTELFPYGCAKLRITELPLIEE